jgi:hypothetical protein
MYAQILENKWFGPQFCARKKKENQDVRSL